MPKRDEPQLCPKCPKLSFLSEVQARSYTRTPTYTSTVKLCAKLRALNMGRPCPHFPKTEKISRYFDMLAGRKTRRRKRKKRRKK